MKITANLGKGILLIGDRQFKISCNVRSLKNEKRRKNEIVRSIPDDFPYDPRPFPKGIWNITGVEWQKNYRFDRSVYGVCKIRTNARQYVKIWSLDNDGDYFQETSEVTNDAGYLLHYSESNTTLGCIRLNSNDDAAEVGNVIAAAIKADEPVYLEVI